MPNKTTDFAAWMGVVQARMETALQRFLPAPEIVPGRLHRAMRYAVLGGGKRVRPLLAFAAGELAASDPARVEVVAAAIEMIHAYSLVHDDLPCMDDDVLRRGRATVHVKYGEALAMLVGDALQALAFESLAAAAGHGAPAGAVASMVAELAHAAGSLGMAGGQAIDLASVGVALDRDALEDMHRRKTGALLRASVRLGGLCAAEGGAGAGEARARRMQALDRYADAIGLAFQVVDDILDVEGDAATLGKTAGKDAQSNKPTYVSALGLDAARQLAGRLREQARDAIAPLGEAGQRLAGLADLIVLRKS